MVTLVAGKLDEISEAIGGLRSDQAGLRRAFEQHCEDDKERHAENRGDLRENNKQLAGLGATLTQVAKTVEEMLPIVRGYQTSRAKRAGVVGVLLALLTGLGWIVQVVIGAVAGWLHRS